MCSNLGYSAEETLRQDPGNDPVSPHDAGVAIAMGATATARRRRHDDDGAMVADWNWTTDDPTPAAGRRATDRGGPEHIRHPLPRSIDLYRST